MASAIRASATTLSACLLIAAFALVPATPTATAACHETVYGCTPIPAEFEPMFCLLSSFGIPTPSPYHVHCDGV